jgi:hypothetical protein
MYLKSANDYYPFGIAIQYRTFSKEDIYKYGFNGQEKSDEENTNTSTA